MDVLHQRVGREGPVPASHGNQGELPIEVDEGLHQQRLATHGGPGLLQHRPRLRVRAVDAKTGALLWERVEDRGRGLDEEAAVALIVNGFAKEVLKELPMEFAVEAQKLLSISLEGAVG